MGDIVKGVASLFGGRKRRREQKVATANLNMARGRQDSFDLQNVYAGMEGPDMSMSGYDPSQAQVGQLAPSATSSVSTIRIFTRVLCTGLYSTGIRS